MTQKKDAKFYIRILVPLLLVLVILGYAYFRTRDLVEGAEITIYEPKNYSAFTDSEFQLKGKITNSSAVFVNDRKIFLDIQGNFNEKLLLLPGYNIITLRTEDKFKRETERKLELVYKEI